jgi:carboxyl-terminal processing protease
MAETPALKDSMTSRSRLLVLLVSTPLIVLVVVGGVLGRSMSPQDSYAPLKTFDEVVNLIISNYVEPVEPDSIMHGAMRGLAEGLDADSAWLSTEEMAVATKRGAEPKGSVGIELTRQYYLRVVSTRDGSPAAKAGLHTGDFVRVIDDKPTREMSVWSGTRMLRGAPGTKVKLTVLRGNATEPHVVELVREEEAAPVVTAKIVKPGIGLVRIPAFSDRSAADLKSQIAALKKDGATSLIIDLRGTAEGSPELGIAPARLFVGDGVLTSKESKGTPKQDVTAAAGDGSVTMPVTLLVTNGTSQAAEVFAAALAGHKRATVVGEHTLGRAATQELVRLPDGSGLWLSTARYLTPGGTPIQEKGVVPDVEVAEPDVEFGAAPSTEDPILNKALEKLAAPAAEKPAA